MVIRTYKGNEAGTKQPGGNGLAVRLAVRASCGRKASHMMLEAGRPPAPNRAAERRKSLWTAVLFFSSVFHYN
ncbi:hypothetical protein J1TS5_48280 [Paenibacillus macerans]|nr:hypothetical protein J1TS5_48280 [Paenibacillus macerans]